MTESLVLVFGRLCGGMPEMAVVMVSLTYGVVTCRRKGMSCIQRCFVRDIRFMS
jgi:hypothetical protein